jgi:hypothetical protein
MPDDYLPDTDSLRRTVRLGTDATRDNVPVIKMGALNVAPITTSYNAAVSLFANDIASLTIRTAFAKGIYNTTPAVANAATTNRFIRTPQQMQNIIGPGTGTTNERIFIQERDIDFATEPINTQGNTRRLTNSVVTGNFLGTYNGGGHLISNVWIESENLNNTNVGLFSQNGNSGTIRNITMFFDGSVSLDGSLNSSLSNIQGAGNVGAIAGENNGSIEDITVISTRTALVDTDDPDEGLYPVVPVSSTSNATGAGGIVGRNDSDGRINRVLYLAAAPYSGVELDELKIYPIVFINNNDNTTNPAVRNAYFLSGTYDDTRADIAGSAGSDGHIASLVRGFNDMDKIDSSFAVIGVPGDTATLRALTTVGTPSSSPPPFGDSIWSTLSANGNGNNYYPYPYIRIDPAAGGVPNAAGAIPDSWPVVVEDDSLPSSAIATLTIDFDDIPDIDDDYADMMNNVQNMENNDEDAKDNDETDDNDSSDDIDIEGEPDPDSENGLSGALGNLDLTGESNTDENDDEDQSNGSDDDSNGEGGEDGETSDINSSDNNTVQIDTDDIETIGATEGIMLGAGIIAVYGGYGFTRTKFWKNYLKRSNARALHRINKYVDRKRRRF